MEDKPKEENFATPSLRETRTGTVVVQRPETIANGTGSYTNPQNVR